MRRAPARFDQKRGLRAMRKVIVSEIFLRAHQETSLDILQRFEKNLDAARRKLDEMLTAKRELEVEVEDLQARMTLVEVAQTSNPVSL